jgi:hypothetical protein
LLLVAAAVALAIAAESFTMEGLALFQNKEETA